MERFKTLNQALEDNVFCEQLDNLNLDYCYNRCTTSARVSLFKTLEEEGINPLINMREIPMGFVNGSEAIRTVIIPSGCEEIEDFAFNCCSGITSLKFEDLQVMRYIGFAAFEDCSSLTEIELDNMRLDTFAFSSCTKLQKATIGKNVDFDGDHIFDRCEKLTIYCYHNSSAEAYAKEYNINIEYLD